jgi:hypothetical protein
MLRSLLLNLAVQGFQFPETAADRHPGIAARGGAHGEVQGDHRVHTALGDGVVAELAVLRVAPGPLGAQVAAAAGGVLVDAVLLLRTGADQEPVGAPVVDDGPALGVIIGGVPLFHAAGVQIVMPEQPHFARAAEEIVDLHPAHDQVMVDIDRVPADEGEAQTVVPRLDTGDQGAGLVAERLPPRRLVQPGHAAIGPDAEAAELAADVVLLADVRPVEVAQDIIVVEGDQQVAVSDRDITGHLSSPCAVAHAGTWYGIVFVLAVKPARCRSPERVTIALPPDEWSLLPFGPRTPSSVPHVSGQGQWSAHGSWCAVQGVGKVPLNAERCALSRLWP